MNTLNTSPVLPENLPKDLPKELRGKRVLLSAGGTGGHVYPALAVAKALRSQGAEVFWLGTQAGIESKLVPEADIPLHTIFVQGVRGNGIKRLLKAPMVIFSAVRQAKKVLKTVRPDVFVGFGGFASGPGAMAAKLSGIPVVIHEQNAAMGLTNKIVSKWAKKVLLAFPISGRKGLVVGNPIRAEITQIAPPSERIREEKPFRVLVIGGSLGAKAINEVVPYVFQSLKDQICLFHQTGKTTYEETCETYKKLGLFDDARMTVQFYIDDMAKAYGEADLIIARAGALTVSEIASVGVPAIFIPLPHAVDNHQFLNAQFLENVKAAKIIEQKDLTAEKLTQTVLQLLTENQLQVMAKNGLAQSHEQALSKIVEIIKEVTCVK